MTLDTDAFNAQIGCVLLQRQSDNTIKLVGYWCCSPTDAGVLYDITQRQCLVIVRPVLLPRTCSECHRFTIRTNDDALEWILNFADSTNQLARWHLHSSESDFEVVHRAGIKY